MFAPAEFHMTAYRGFTFDPSFQLYQDVARTTPQNLTGWTVSMVIGEEDDGSAVFTLTAGSGITVTPLTGLVQASLSGASVSSVTDDRLRWYLQLVDPAGNVRMPLRGLITFEDPL